MRVRTTQEELSKEDIASLLFRHEQEFMPRVMRLKRYYAGDHDILRKLERANGAPNNKIVANYCEYIANMNTGFFMGQPVAYSSQTEDEEEVEALTEVLKYNDEAAHNIRLAEEASITGDAYEIIYTDSDAEIRFSAVPSEQIIMVTDASLEENLLCAIRRFGVRSVDGSAWQEYVDVYDRAYITHYRYKGGQLELLGEPEPHYFDDIPVVEYPNNEAHRGDFEGVITLVDAYDKAQSLTLDDMEDFTDAYLVLKGMGGTTGDDAKELRRNKILSLDEGGSAEWLIKNLNDSYIENIKTRLQNDIHKFSSVPDMSDDSFAGNASGVAIKYKLLGMEQIRSRKERCFKKGLQRRIEIIAGMLRTKSKADIDFRDISITFTANLPANLQEQAQIVSQLDGMISRKTLLSLLPFVTDPKEEMEELDKEREDEGAGDYAELGGEPGGEE